MKMRCRESGMTKIKKPIFIIGTGRCGSSIFHRLLSYHPQLAWTSGFCNKFPKASWINRVILALDNIGFLQNFLRRYIGPSETTLYWEYLAPGFSFAIKDLKRVDLHPSIKRNIIAALEKIETKKRCRQLHKFTGWPRTDYLLSIFPDAKFIHIYRDGRAVAHSLFEINWWQGWRGPENWLWGLLPAQYQKEWEDHQHSFLVLAAIQWKLLMDSYEEAKVDLSKDQYLELRYEELIENPQAIFNSVLDFCELEKSPNLTNAISKVNLKNKNEKWKMNLSDKQKELLESCMASHLKKYDYI